MEASAVPPAPDIIPSPTTRHLIVATTVAPLLWLAHLIGSFALVRFACANNASWLLHVLSGAALVLAAAGTWVGWRAWHARSNARMRADDPNSFVAAVGLGSSALFTAIIALSWIASFVIAPCDLV